MGRYDRNEPIEVRLFVLGGATERAIRVRLEDDFGDDEGAWLPWSQVESIEDDDGPVDPDELSHGDVATFTIPLWLAEDRGFA